MPTPVTVTKTGPGLAQLKKQLEKLRKTDVLVGIPAEGSSRLSKAEAISEIQASGKTATKARIARQIRHHDVSGPAGAGINNAELLFVQSKGSPLRHIPARPVLEPAIKADHDLIDPHLKAAAKATLENQPQRADRELRLAGTVAMNLAKKWFVDPRNGWAPNAPSTIARKGSDRPLIDTAAMRAALTYVLREKS